VTPENFCYWLQGYLELSEKGGLSSQQVKVVREHLALVMQKVTPSAVGKDDKDSLANRLRAIQALPRCSGSQKLC